MTTLALARTEINLKKTLEALVGVLTLALLLVLPTYWPLLGIQ